MEGILEKFDTINGIWSSGVWTKYFCILHEQVLLITDVNQRSNIVGKLHMQISKILPSGQDEVEIKLHSGLVEVRLKAESIKQVIEWKNALTNA